MQRLFLAFFALFIAFALPIHDAEAKRFGGGRSSGIQRDSLPQRQASPQRNADAPGQGAANNPGRRSWMGPVAGLAAGLGLAALASHLGLGEEFANVLMIGLLIISGLFLFFWLTRRQAQNIPQGIQYAGHGIGHASAQQTVTSSGHTEIPHTTALPAGFDAEGFIRQAKLNFIRLQAANDAGNLDDIREFTTPEMYAEIKLQMSERGDTHQRTEVMLLEAEVLETAEETNRRLVSVRFHGLIREDVDTPAVDFDEVWHLTKPLDNSRGWAVAGIQQIQ